MRILLTPCSAPHLPRWRAWPVLVALLAGLCATPVWADDGDDGGSSDASDGSQQVEIEEVPLAVDAESFSVNELVALNPSNAALASAARLGLSVVERSTQPGLSLRVVRLRLPAGLDARSALDVLAPAHPDTFDLHHRYALAQAPAAPACQGAHCGSWAQVAWPADAAACGRAQRIGIIDTEVAAEHPALRGADIVRMRFLADGRTPSDDDHGTVVAGLLVAAPSPQAGAGLVPRARLLAANSFHRLPSGSTSADALDLIKALDWLVTQRVRVVGMSLAGPPNRALAAAIEQAHRRGVLVVAAAGNGGPNAPPAYPAAWSPVLAVTAIDAAGRPYRRAQQGEHIDFAAPGVGLAGLAAADGPGARSGTSFAVPFVVALASQTLQQGLLGADDWQRGASRLVQDLGAPGRDAVFGWGLPRLAQACR
ncbi:MAG: S8 family serine peptidase [Hydrogenophaga sp.]|nr:S8 family serine peptidase [Hydrogenophaga sp.]